MNNSGKNHPIKIHTFPEKSSAVIKVADEIETLIKSRSSKQQKTVLGLATGSSPIALYQELIRRHRNNKLSFQNVITFNLDEYSGLQPDHPESYWHFMHQQLFNHIDIPQENIHIPSGTVATADIASYCQDYEQAIRDAGGLDFQLLGIGRSGHIGFNEPPSDQHTRTRQVTLHPITREDAAPAFNGLDHVPTKAITMGVATVLDAKRIALLAWGQAKAEIIAKTLNQAPSPEVPATYLQTHPNTAFFIDHEAASGLSTPC